LTWQIEFTPVAAKQLKKIGPENERRILKFLRKNICDDPHDQGKMLRGALREFWRYRIGDFRVIARLEEEKFIVLIVRVGHRRQIYRTP